MVTRLGGTYLTPTDSQAFTDLNRLAQLKGQNRDSEENVKKVAQEFESLFVSQMMKSMRSASDVLADKDSPFNSETAKQYRDMYDQQLALSLSRNNGGIGLASTLQRQLSHQASGVGRHNPFAAVQQAASASAGATPAPTADSRPAPAVLRTSGHAPPPVDPARDDSKLLNARRLALPGSIAQRLAAGIVPSADGDSGKVQTIAQQLAVDPPKTSAGNPFAPSDSEDRVASGRAAGRLDHAQAVAMTASNPTFKSKADFINTMLPMAEAAAKRLGVDPRYLVAQAALETGWGKHMLRQPDGRSTNNLFGIKAHGWGGATVTAQTQEYQQGRPVKEEAKFRAYSSYAESFHDYVDFLQRNGRYQDALAASGDSEAFVHELQDAGYATDPHYARKVSQIARNIDTYQSIQTDAVQVAASAVGTTNL